jgi:hypothetical protein
MNSLISMPVPGVVQLMQAAFMNLLFFDIFYTEEWLPFLFPLDPLGNDETGLNEYFDDNGFGTTLFIVNFGSAIVFIMFQFALFAIYPLFALLAKYLTL